MTVDEFEWQNESSLRDFNVQARLIYDNSTGTDVTKAIGQLMANHGFISGAVTLSVGLGRPCEASGCLSDCSSVYGDSGQILSTDELQSAFYGGVFGDIPYIAWSGTMACDNSTAHGCGAVGSPGWYACATQGMITLPGSHPVPTVTDIHATPCLLISQTNLTCGPSFNATAAATTFYNDVWGYLQYRSLTGGAMIFGETSSNQPLDGHTLSPCNIDTPTLTQQNAAGYEASLLYSHDAANVSIRPWDDSRSTNCVTPISIGAPSGPYKP